MLKEITKEQRIKLQQCRNESQPKLAVKLSGNLSIWIEERNYILKDKNKIIGYFPDLLKLVWCLFDRKVKLTLGEETDLKGIIKKLELSEQYIRDLAKKLEVLPKL